MEAQNKTTIKEKKIKNLKKEIGLSETLKYSETEIKILYKKNQERLNQEIKRIKKFKSNGWYLESLQEQLNKDLLSFWIQEESKQTI